MADWLMTAHIGLVAILILWIPGLFAGYVVGLRGLVAWGTAPLLSGAIVGMSAIVAGQLGARWSVLVVLVGTVLLSAVLFGVRVLARRWRSPVVRTDRRARWTMFTVVVVSAGVAGLFQARRLATAIGSPDAIAQTYDTPYHLNSVARMLETGDASSLHMTLTTPGRTTTFYPGLWHGVTALVADLTGAEVTVTANWMSLVIACVVWPMSLVVFARVLFGPRPVLLGLTGVMAFAMTQFPNQLTAFGVLYPNLLSYALLPSLLAVLWMVLWRARGRQRLAPLAVAGLGCIAVTLAQPNGLFTVGYVLVPLLVHYAAHLSWRAHRRGEGLIHVVAPWVILIVGSVAAYWAAGQLSLVAAFRQDVTWLPDSTIRQGTDDVLSLAVRHPTDTANVVIAVAILVGIATCLVVSRWRWIAVGYLILGALYVVAAGTEGPLRAELIGYWYGDPERLASQLPILGIPLAVVGVATILRIVSEFLERRVPPRRLWRAVVSTGALAIVVGLVFVVVLPRTTVYKDSFEYIAGNYEVDPDSTGSTGLINQNELTMMRKITEIVPEDVVIAGNPWDGSSMTLALAGREPLIPHTAIAMDPDRTLISTSLNRAHEDPAVCDAVRRLNVGYVLRSGNLLIDGTTAGYEGLTGLLQHDIARLVVEEGDSRLYKITACG